MTLGIEHFLLILAVGFITKLTDNICDFGSDSWIKYPTGLLTGLAVGYLLSLDVYLTTLTLAIIFGNLAFGRIDAKPHQLTILGVFVSIVVFGLEYPILEILALLSFFAFLDELLNDEYDAKYKRMGRVIGFVLKYRITLEVACLVLSVVTMNPVYFASILMFDLGYVVSEKVTMRYMKQQN